MFGNLEIVIFIVVGVAVGMLVRWLMNRKS
jgi:NhaP-type Na+/H+ or K+/H+ antiporter